jgi:hypothetical protein
MGFLDSIKSIFSGSGGQAEADQWLYVRCRRCGEVIKTRLDLQNALEAQDEGGFMMRKTLVGNQLCFQRIEVTLLFDDNRRLIEQEVQHGQLLSAAEYEAAQADSSS